jgi:hypothetical protein
MKVCHIVPANYVGMCPQNSTMHLLIAPEVLKNKQYEEVYKEKSLKGDFIIMDNGAFEYGNAFPLDDVIKAAELVQAKELVLPDYYLEGATTVQRVKEALDEYSKKMYTYPILQNLSLMAVPQGKTIDEYILCFSELLQMHEVDTIGFSYGAINEAFRSWDAPNCLLRPMAISYLNKHFNFSKCEKQFHCLGISGHPVEIKFLKLFEFIRSVDSSKAFVCALNDIDIEETHDIYLKVPKRPDDYFSIKNVSENVEKLVLKNIETMEEYNV